jgi:cytochrome c peroxidase
MSAVESPRRGRFRANLVGSHALLAGALLLGLVFACSSDGLGTPAPTPAPTGTSSGTPSQDDGGGQTDDGGADGKPEGGGSVCNLATQDDIGFEYQQKLPNLELLTPEGTLKLDSLRADCNGPPEVLVIQLATESCASCTWLRKHTNEIVQAPLDAKRVQWLHVVVSNRYGLPVRSDDLARIKAESPTALGAIVGDPKFQFAPITDLIRVLPSAIYVDRRTMRVLSAEETIHPRGIRKRLENEFAGLEGRPERPVPQDDLYDEVFTPMEWELIQQMKWTGQLPPDPTNRVADDARAATLGRSLFEDKGFSLGGQGSCATCHDRSKGMADGLAVSTAAGTGTRSAPSVLFAAYSKFQFWDGRSDSLWSQALGPFENPLEFASTRTRIIRHALTTYENEFRALFPAETAAALAALPRLPASGKPGDAAFDGLPPADKNAVNAMYAAVGKAIAAYERSLKPGRTRLDDYIDGNKAALAPDERGGLKAFFTAGCIQCHSGPTLADDAFHNIRFPGKDADGKADVGAPRGLAQLLQNPYRQTGAFVDGPSPWASDELYRRLAMEARPGQFKTPSLRNVALTAPYGHAGTSVDLRAVVKHYGERGLKQNDPDAVGETEPWVSQFANHALQTLPAFLKVLDAKPTQ